MDFIKAHKKIIIIAGTSVAVIALAIIAILLIGGKADDNKDTPVVTGVSSTESSSDTSSILIPEIVVKDESEPASSKAPSSESEKKKEEKLTAKGDVSSKAAAKSTPVVSQVEKKTASKPVEPPKPPAPSCNCTEKCDLDHASTTCTICKEPAADFTACKGNPPQCICRAKCTDTTNDRCRICMHSYALEYDCLGTETIEPPYNPSGPQHGDKEADPDPRVKYRHYHVGMNAWLLECQFICQRLGEHPEETDYNNFAQYMEHGDRCVAHKIGVDGKPFDSLWCQYCKMFIQEKFVQLHNDEKI